MLLVTRTRIQLPWNTFKKKGSPQTYCYDGNSKEKKERNTRRSRDESVSMAFTLKSEESSTTRDRLARCQGKSLPCSVKP